MPSGPCSPHDQSHESISVVRNLGSATGPYIHASRLDGGSFTVIKTVYLDVNELFINLMQHAMRTPTDLDASAEALYVSEATHFIGQPLKFVSGQFAGQVIRVELQELQKADLGRKLYAKVDRRPLDPPPTVLLRIFHVDHFGEKNQCEQEIEDYGEVRRMGILCTVDLFPVPDRPRHSWPSPTSQAVAGPSRAANEAGALTYYPLHPFSEPGGGGHATPPFELPRHQFVLCTLPAQAPHDVVFRFGSHLVTESSKLTPALVGEKFTEPELVDFEGKRVLVFVFNDLAVQREGTFILRYRVFDISSVAQGNFVHPIQAETYGGPFRVYSSREFPGLSPSTELTKALARHGVRVTMREAERSMKKRPTNSDPRD